MTFRPWVVAGLLIVGVLVNTALLAFERLPVIELVEKVIKFEEPLTNLQYLAGNRRTNFQTMGMEFEMAESTANEISRLQGQAPRFTKMLSEQSAEIAQAFCPGALPQPYAALAYLVEEDNGVRRVVDPIALTRFERQPWYDLEGLVPGLYERFEQTESRKAEATLMAVSAALLGLSGDALANKSPWSTGLAGRWGFSRLSRRQPRANLLAIKYFSLMHFFTELANTPDGICKP